jgi:DNA-binding NarL/FixJ family response regulator
VAERFGPGRDPEGSANASYQAAEIHRLRGELELAEAAYDRVSALGGEPQPGLSLLRQQQGRPEQAASGLRAALAGSSNPLRRVRLLPALVEIALELADASEARAACEELEATAARYGTEALEALAAAARAAVLLAEGNAASAVEPLRRAFSIWQRLGAAHPCARVRLQLAQACRALGDAEGARLELAHARQIFEQLGAVPDLERAQPAELAPSREGLTRRELEVLRWVAAGKTNRAIAQQLGLSEKTVDRHVSNIFTKLDVSSRAAATAHAYQKRLL